MSRPLDKVQQAFNCAKASLAVEGLFITPEEEALVKERLEGKITENEFTRQVLEMINR